MSDYGQFKCRECGEYFDEPHRWVERHGFDYGPFEHWSACPYCDSCDYDEAYVVEREEEAALEDLDEDGEPPSGGVAQGGRRIPSSTFP